MPCDDLCEEKLCNEMASSIGELEPALCVSVCIDPEPRHSTEEYFNACPHVLKSAFPLREPLPCNDLCEEKLCGEMANSVGLEPALCVPVYIDPEPRSSMEEDFHV